MCAQEVIAAFPDRKFEEMSQQDTEEATREKVMAQVKFETSIYKVQQKFGEELMKEVLDSAKPGAVGVKGLAGTPELEELKAKIQMMDGGDHTEPSAQAAQAAPTPEIRSKAAARPPEPKDTAPPADSGDSFPTALVVSIAVAAMAVLGGFWILKRRRE